MNENERNMEENGRNGKENEKKIKEKRTCKETEENEEKCMDMKDKWKENEQR